MGTINSWRRNEEIESIETAKMWRNNVIEKKVLSFVVKNDR